MATLSSDQREQFLADVRVGVVAVERPGRAPLALPIWYGYEPGGDVWIWTTRDSLKHRLISDAGMFTLTVQVQSPPYRYVSAEGDVVGIDDATRAEVTALASRYLGPEAGENYAAESSIADQVIIRMRPNRWHSMDEAA